jgi:hypothetical protein
MDTIDEFTSVVDIIDHAYSVRSLSGDDEGGSALNN